MIVFEDKGVPEEKWIRISPVSSPEVSNNSSFLFNNIFLIHTVFSLHSIKFFTSLLSMLMIARYEESYCATIK